MMKKFLQAVSAILIFTATAPSSLFAQLSGCPEVDARVAGGGKAIVLPCGQTCTTLSATAFSAAQTTSYTVSQIPYAPPFSFNAGTPILVSIDDRWSSVINLPFSFCFFGNTYNQIVVGSNGVVSFNTTNAGGFNNWQINGPIPSTTPADMRNCIMGPWQDIDPTDQGEIRYQILGTAPCRTFEVSWYQVPYYGDENSVYDPGLFGSYYCSPQFATQQIVLYETTNAIDVYIQNKGVCSGWNGGVAIEGIQNATGTMAYTVPGRNATVWSAANDAWRFTPSGASNTTIAWFDGATQIGTGATVQVCPASSRRYYAQATYTNCDNSTIVVRDSVYVGVSAGLSATIDSVVNPFCNGGSSGAAYASFTSTGTAVLSYRWLPGGAPNSTSITNITAGTYIFSVTDGANCTKYDTVTLTNPPAFAVNVPDSNAYTCIPGNISGSLVAYPSGGSGNVTYSWINGDTAQSITGLQAGCYSVTVTDAQGCTATDQGCVIQNVTPPIFDSPVITNVSCTGAADGSITVNMIHSTGTVAYEWSNGLPPGQTVTGLAPGPYFVTGTDANGCTATATYSINEPTPLVIGSPTITEATCNIGGTISVSASGGTPSYNYSWQNGDNGSTADSLQAGSYNLTVTDQNGCTATATYTVIGDSSVIIFGIPTIVNVSCNGGNNGGITVTASGGTGGIIYSWNNTIGATNSGLTAGNYTVTATDSLTGCFATATYTVNEPTAIVLGTPTITQATCAAGGSILVTATGGTGTLAYSWSNGQTGSSISNLAGGTYILTVTDSNNCTVSDSYIVPVDPAVVTFGTPIITDVECNGFSTGSIVATASGGTGTIQFHWSNNVNASTITNVPAGSYSVTITDQANCSASTTYTITQPPAITAGLTFPSMVCINTPGYACASASNGAAPYTYTWSNFSDSACAVDLFPGQFTVTITDANGCSVAVTDTLKTAPDFTPTSVSQVFPCSSNPFGNDTILVVDGLPPFTFVLVGVDTNTTGIFNDLPPGSYTWIVYDSLGCSKSSVFDVPESAANDQYDIAADSVFCFGGSDGSITVTPLSQNGPYSYSIDGGSFQSSNQFSDLGEGTYTIVAQNTYGCTVSLSATVEQPDPASAAIPDTIISAPGVDNAVVVTTQGFVNPVYTWTPTDGLSCTDCPNPTVNVNTATVFYVTVSEADHSNCIVNDSVVVIISGGYVLPNAFTPNGDGKNDFFGPVSFGPLTIKSFRIYNRWGQVVHNSTDNWDGTFKGTAQPAGTYIYYVEVEYPDPDHPGTDKTESKQGSFALVR